MSVSFSACSRLWRGGRCLMLCLALLCCTTLLADSVSSVGRIDTVRFVAPDSIPLYMTVYTPPAYSPDSVYPSLYLLHGIHGNQYIWEQKANLKQLVDSMITYSLLRPMVIVMPICTVHDSTYAYKVPSYSRCMFDFERHIKKGEFEAYFPYIADYVGSHYSVYPYAIAGLSAGGRQAAMLSNPEYYTCKADTLPRSCFTVVGLFSPVLTDQQLPRSSVGCVYWIRGGGGDLFYPRARRANRYLNYRNIPIDFQRTRGRHNWNTWRKYIHEFLLFAFSPTSKALLYAESALKNTKLEIVLAESLVLDSLSHAPACYDGDSLHVSQLVPASDSSSLLEP